MMISGHVCLRHPYIPCFHTFFQLYTSLSIVISTSHLIFSENVFVVHIVLHMVVTCP